MTRLILALAFALVAVAPSPARAQQPTPAQIEKAKKAFGEGRKLFDMGDFVEAAAKFKESYNLSKNPVLLYNIGFANEKAGQDDVALYYYRKFLADAPPDATQRPEVTDRVKELEKKFQGGGTTPGPTTPEPVKPEPAKPEPAKPVKIKPAGTYSATDFQHQVVDVAPPKKALDVTAFVPEDSGFEVTLYFRTAGEGKFTAKPMKWRYKELVARIPPEKMIGDSVQYYIEVKDTTGAVVTRAAKSTSPNLVTLEPGAPERYYPDFSDDGTVASPQETRRQDLEEDPLNKNGRQVKDDDSTLDPRPIGGGDKPPSSTANYVKWGATGTSALMLGLSVLFHVQAGKQATALEEDFVGCGMPPCRKFDQYAQDVESAGQRNQTLSRVTLVVGIGAAGVAGYYWYKSLKAPKHREINASRKASGPETSWSLVPAAGEGYTGAAALIDF